MDEKIAKEFIEKYIELCKYYGLYLWSGEPWYGLDLLKISDEEKNTGKKIEDIIRDNIFIAQALENNK